MINLNSDSFKEREYAAIFNGGKAGRVENVTLEVTKRTPIDPENQPDYKLFAVDNNEAKINEGFYYADENDSKRGDILVSRLVHVARAVLGKDYQFPEYSSYKEATDGLFTLIAKNIEGKTFNVFTTYGNIGYPSKYLKLRYFDFIEPGEVTEANTRLFVKKTDLMERIMPDASEPSGNNDSPFGEPVTKAAPSDDWLGS